MAGGCIHRAWRLEGEGGQPLFIKTNRASALPLLHAEAEGLVALAAMAAGNGAARSKAARSTAARRATAGIDALTIPTPLALGTVGDWSVLALPWLDLVGGPGGPPAGTGTAAWAAAGGWRQLGKSLARLHRQSQLAHGDQGFGWGTDNYIGSTIQLNGWLPDWG